MSYHGLSGHSGQGGHAGQGGQRSGAVWGRGPVQGQYVTTVTLSPCDTPWRYRDPRLACLAYMHNQRRPRGLGDGDGLSGILAAL
jgi:hypothetical protein